MSDVPAPPAPIPGGRTAKRSDLIARRIRQMIVAGELAVGDWLPTEAELMIRFGVSRPTLREAFRLLEADSLIRIRQGPPGGAQVQVPGAAAAAPLVGLLLTLAGTTVRDVYEARLLVEPIAARRLAERGSPAQHARLREEARRVLALTADQRQFVAAGACFARCLVELAGNQSIALISAVLEEVLARHLGTSPAVDAPERLERRLRLAEESYRRLPEFVDARNGAGAERCWRAHLEAAGPEIALVDDQVINLIG